MLNRLFYFILLKKFRVTKPDILYVIMQDNIYIYIYLFICAIYRQWGLKEDMATPMWESKEKPELVAD
jgi:hypothetical protein